MSANGPNRDRLLPFESALRDPEIIALIEYRKRFGWEPIDPDKLRALKATRRPRASAPPQSSDR